MCKSPFLGWPLAWLTILTLIVCDAHDTMKTHYMTDFCQQNENKAIFELRADEDASGWLLVTNASSYTAGFDCSLVLTAPDRLEVYLSFVAIDTRNCTYDRIRIRYGNDSVPGRDLCGTLDCKNESCTNLMFVSGDAVQNLTIDFASSSDVAIVESLLGFKALFTVFGIGDCLTRDRFECKNGFCISSRLVCDGHNNCMDWSDEDDKICGRVSKEDTVWGILSIVAGVLLMSIFMPLIVYLAICGVRKNVRISTTSFDPSARGINVEVDSLMSSLEQSHGVPATYGGTMWYAAACNGESNVDGVKKGKVGPTSAGSDGPDKWHFK